MAAQLPEIAAVGVAIETSKGSANAPTTAQTNLEVEDLSYEVQVLRGERDPLGASFDTPVDVPGPKMVEFSFRCPLAGRLAAGLAPAYGNMLRLCGLSETISPSTSVTYALISRVSSQETGTIDLFVDGKRIRVLGAMANAVFNLVHGGVSNVEFSGRGIFDDETDNDLPANIPYHEIAPPSAVGVTLTYKSNSMIATQLALDLGNDIQLRPDMTASSGYKHAVCVKRKPQVTLDPEDELVATIDFLAQLEANNVAELLAQWGSAAGNTLRLLMPQAQLVGAPYGERNGLKTRNLTFAPRRATVGGDDALTLRYT